MTQDNAPAKKKRRPLRDVRLWVYLMIVPYILIAVATGAYVELQHPLKLETPVTLTIKPGQSLRATLAELQKMDVFASGGQELYLHIWARLSHAARHIKAGEY
ncbi:MAG: hypothetical protein L0H29_05735, partial [Sinobacteraceae bacterium]|nr:hypothetical protein [Nevskiaceae bacterium]